MCEVLGDERRQNLQKVPPTANKSKKSHTFCKILGSNRGLFGQKELNLAKNDPK